MFCPKCGKKREGEGKFCGGCGYKFEEGTISYKENREEIRKPQATMNHKANKEGQATTSQSTKGNNPKMQQSKVKNTSAKKKSNKPIVIAIFSVAFLVILLISVMFLMMGGDDNFNNGNYIATDNNSNSIEDNEIKNNDVVNNNSEDNVDNIEDNNQDSSHNNDSDNISNDGSNNPHDIEDNSNPIEDNSDINDSIYDSEYIEPFSIDSSSYLEPSNDNHYFPENINDYNNETAWVEAAAGDGSGEWIQLNFDKEVILNGIDFEVGYKKSKDIYLKNNRPKNVRVEFSDGSDIYIEFSDGFEYGTRIEMDSVKTTYVKVIIEDVYKGSSYDDACISEIHVY